MDIILASSSLRRIEMMNEFNIPYRVQVSNVNEDISCDLKPEEIVMELSKRKALEVFKNNKDSFVLGFDTIVYLDGMIIGKPKDYDDCVKTIKMLRNRWHSVYTGSYIVSKDFIKSFYTKTDVYIGDISDKEIDEYAKTSEPYDKAGGYAIQGTFKKYVKEYKGDLYTIIGMPKEIIYKILMDYIKNN